MRKRNIFAKLKKKKNRSCSNELIESRILLSHNFFIFLWLIKQIFVHKSYLGILLFIIMIRFIRFNK